MKLLSLSALLLVALPGTLRAAALGQPAAPLEIAEWIKGEAVDLASARGKQVLVVEFWATWCGPCKTSIPHLTELQRKFADRGVVVIGVSDEPASKVQPFVDGMGDKMDYTVALDRDRKTSAGYMGAFGVNGIPHAFVVDTDGNIAWHGHPMAGLDEALEKIATRAGVQDPTLKKNTEARQLLRDYAEMAAKGGDDPRLVPMENRLLTLDRDLGGIVPGQKLDLPALRKSARFQALMRDYQRAVAAGKPQAEIQQLETLAAPLAPPGFDFATFRGQYSLQRVYQDYYRAATGKGDAAKLPELAKRLGETRSDNAEMLTEIAWTLLTDDAIKNRDPKLALKLAESAVTASGGTDPNALDTYAQALFETGDTPNAIVYQKKAISLTTDPARKAELQNTLKQFERGNSR